MKSKLLKTVCFTTHLVLTACLLSLSQYSAAQTITALPSNGSFSQESGPQGALRHQRKFYLITAAELKASGLTASTFNSIGFTNAVAQDSVTKGKFKLFFQNTSDTVARIDTNWTYVTSTTNFYRATGLFPGNYEWQVSSACTTSPLDTAAGNFSTDDQSACKRPTSFRTDSITSSSATFSWVSPVSAATRYVVQYTAVDFINWMSDTVSTSYYKAQGLTAGKYYQWRVQTLCSGNLSSEPSSADGAFATTGSCTIPSGLTTGGITDSSAVVAWSAVSGASLYSMQYRRTGTTSWFGTSTSTTGVIVRPLKAGTTYEWQVATVCATGTGAYKAGTPFTTTGTLKCYAPGNLSVDSITTNSAKLTWSAQPNVSTYNIRYRLKESISWAHAVNGMDTLHVEKDSITIPNITGAYNIPFKAANTFAYSGGGLYIAWEYTNDSGKVSSFNTSLSNSRKTPILSFSERSTFNDTSHLPVLTSTTDRPATLLGSSSLVDVAQVSAVYALGYNAAPYSNPTPVSALITNNSTASKTFNVSLSIKSATNKTAPYTTSQSVTINGGSSSIVSFANINPQVLGTDSIIVSIPVQTNENVVNNNSGFYLQRNNSTLVGYADSTSSITSAGFDTLGGLLLTKYKMNACGKINGAHVFLTSSAKKHAVYAVLLNASGNIVATSSAFTPDSTQVNMYHRFYFTTKVVLKDTDYYIGLAQTAAKPGYLPVGVQYEPVVRSSAYYRADLNGSNLKDSANKGRLMILAEVISGVEAPLIVGRTILCAGATDSLIVTSKSVRYADSVIAVSSQRSVADFSASQILGAPDVYPDYGPNPNAWISNAADASREYIELKFFNPAPINYVDIFETYNLGAVDTVFVKNPATGKYESVYSSTASSKNTSPVTSRINRITFSTTAFNVAEVRLALNSPAVSGFNAIDAVGVGLISNPPTFTSLTWSPGGATTSKITINSAGTYKVSVTNGDGCAATDSITVTTPPSITPAITPAGPVSFCMGDSIKLTSSQAKGNTWSNGDTTGSIMVKSAGSYSVTYFDGCGNRQSNTVTVNVNPLPVVTITGVKFICSGASTTLDAGSGYSAYKWSTGAITQTITVSSQGVYSVTVVNGNGCSGNGSATITVAQSPTPAITGNSRFCPGSSTILDAGTGYKSYAWSTSATTSTISINSAATYAVVVTDNNGCTGSASVVTSALTPPAPVISGSLSFCAGNSTTLDAGLGYASYVWSTGSTNHSITATAVQTYSVIVTDNNGCTGSASVTTNAQSSIPVTPGPISGPVTGLCSGSYVYSIASVTDAAYYNWTAPGGTSITSGQGTTSVTLNVSNTFTSGNLIVAASNSCGQSPSLNPRTLALQALPAAPGPISGTSTGVCGPTSKAYSISSVPSASTYNWSVPAGATITSGQGTSSIMVSFATGYVAGTICVKSTSVCGNSGNSCLTVAGIPPTPGPISGIVSVCSKQKNVTYTVQPVPGTTSYTWTVPAQASITSGQGTNSIVVTYSTKAGDVTVKASNTCGNSGTQSLAINMNCTGATTTNAIVSAGATKTNAIDLELNTISSVTQIIAYPNPSNGIVKLTMPNELQLQQYAVSVFDAYGKNVFSRVVRSDGNNIVLDLRQLAKGLYLINVSGGRKNEIVKVILQ